MSIKEQLSVLEQEGKRLQALFETNESEVKGLCSERDCLVEKVKVFQTRKSSLAKELEDEYRKQILEIEQKIDQLRESMMDIQKLMDINKSEISKITDCTTLYIEEQANQMIVEFLEYFQTHLKDIARDIKRTFWINGVTRYEEDRDGGCHIPTGIVAIYDQSNNILITKSKDFYFRKALYRIERDDWFQNLRCFYTEWYMKFLDEFKKILRQKIKETFKDDENFKLTIEESEFTLELV